MRLRRLRRQWARDAADNPHQRILIPCPECGLEAWHQAFCYASSARIICGSCEHAWIWRHP